MSGRAAAGRAAALGIALLAGCQSPPLTPAQVAALDFGPRPEGYQKIVRDYLRPRLSEPDFAVIEFRAGPSPLYQNETLSRERQYGWGVCVTVDERDTRGGFKTYPMVVYIRGGQVVAADGGTVERAADLRYAHAQCKQLGYEVF